mmetsp:Transcript_65132/g.183335  ORF Transcript_65132/g.183335 Transcript_65132/m.183335 type:complete len:282 (+) Transcript_65132:136-981(+)
MAPALAPARGTSKGPEPRGPPPPACARASAGHRIAAVPAVLDVRVVGEVPAPPVPAALAQALAPGVIPAALVLGAAGPHAGVHEHAADRRRAEPAARPVVGAALLVGHPAAVAFRAEAPRQVGRRLPRGPRPRHRDELLQLGVVQLAVAVGVRLVEAPPLGMLGGGPLGDAVPGPGEDLIEREGAIAVRVHEGHLPPLLLLDLLRGWLPRPRPRLLTLGRVRGTLQQHVAAGALLRGLAGAARRARRVLRGAAHGQRGEGERGEQREQHRGPLATARGKMC